MERTCRSPRDRYALLAAPLLEGAGLGDEPLPLDELDDAPDFDDSVDFDESPEPELELDESPLLDDSEEEPLELSLASFEPAVRLELPERLSVL